MKIDENTAKEIARLSKIYIRKEKEMREAQEQLKAFVFNFMEKTDMLNSSEDTLEMIGHLPQGYLSFTLWERYHELTKVEKSEAVTQSPSEAMGQTFG